MSQLQIINRDGTELLTSLNPDLEQNQAIALPDDSISALETFDDNVSLHSNENGSPIITNRKSKKRQRTEVDTDFSGDNVLSDESDIEEITVIESATLQRNIFKSISATYKNKVRNIEQQIQAYETEIKSLTVNRRTNLKKGTFGTKQKLKELNKAVHLLRKNLAKAAIQYGNQCRALAEKEEQLAITKATLKDIEADRQLIVNQAHLAIGHHQQVANEAHQERNLVEHQALAVIGDISANRDNLVAQLQFSEQERAKLITEVTRIQNSAVDEKNDLLNKISALEHELIERNQQSKADDDEFIKLSEQLYETQEERNQLKQSAKKLAEELKSVQKVKRASDKEIDDLKKENIRLNEKRDNLEKTIDRFQLQANEYQKALTNSDNDNQKLIADLRNKLQENHSERNELLNKVDSFKTTYERDLQRAVNGLNELKFKNQALENENKTLKEETAELIDTRNKLSLLQTEVARLSTNNQGLEQKGIELQGQIVQYKNEIASLKDSLELRKQEINNFRVDSHNKDSEISRLKYINSLMPNTQRRNLTSSQQQNSTMTTRTDLVTSYKLRKEIPLFNGRLDDQRVQDWFEIAERVARGVGWDDNQRITSFSDRFRDRAEEYHNEISTQVDNNGRHVDVYNDYDEWKALIIERFKDKNEEESYQQELEDATQMRNERVDDFLSRIKKMFPKAYGSEVANSTNTETQKFREGIIKRIFEQGLYTDIYDNYVARQKSNATLEQALEAARQAEEAVRKQRKVKSRKQSSAAQITALELHQEELTKKVNILAKDIENNLSTRSQEPCGRTSRSHSPSVAVVDFKNQAHARGRSTSLNGRYDSSRRATPVRNRSNSLGRPSSPFLSNNLANRPQSSDYRTAVKYQTLNPPRRQHIRPYLNQPYLIQNQPFYNTRKSSWTPSVPFRNRPPLPQMSSSPRFEGMKSNDKRTFDNNTKQCYRCNRLGHIRKDCRVPWHAIRKD